MNLVDLCKQIDQASQSYYTPKGKKIISDAQYDALVARLREIDPTNERLTRVGPPYSLDELRTKVAHKIPMGSLDNTPGGLEGFVPWYDKVCATLGTGVMLNASFKMDGFSVELDYVDGKLVKAVTRGNGEVGDDVTANAVRWQQVPTLLPTPLTCTVRGEGVLFLADFEELRQQAAERGEDVSNPRNLGTGMSGRSDGEGNERLRFFAFNVLRDNSASLTDDLNWLEGLGFVPVKHILTNDKNKIINLFDAMQGGGRAKLPFEIDGIVVCVDDRGQQQALLTTPRSALRPPYARAIKFETMKARTKVVDILLTVGKTGKIVPTLAVEPIKIGGVTVDSALLNNWNPNSENPSAAHIGVGDLVEVERSGDVIPKAVAVIEPAYRCPECGFVGTLQEQQEHHPA